MLDQIMAEMMRMKLKNLQRGYDWTQEFVRPEPIKISLMDRFLPSIGEALIRLGYKLKQRSHARLTARHAQTPNFLIML